jgi:hypothetical protein
MPNGLKLRRRYSSTGGLTVGQVLCLVFCWGLFAYLAAPTVQVWAERRKANRELVNLSLIESAKREWALENPGKVLDDPQRLLRYLPEGRFPESPWGGRYDRKDEQGRYVYTGLLDVSSSMSSPHQTRPSYGGGLLGRASVEEGEVRPTVLMSPVAPSPVLVGPSVVVSQEAVAEGGELGKAETLAGNVNSKDSGASKDSDEEAGRGQVMVAEAPFLEVEVEPKSGPRWGRFLFAVKASDPEGGTLEYSFDGLDFGPSPVWERSFEDLGAKEVRVRVRDEQGLVTEGVAKVDVVNLPPEIRLSASPGRGYRGQDFVFLAMVRDPEGDSLKVRFNRGPWGEATEVKVGAKELGDLKVLAEVEDEHGARSGVEASAQVVNRPPALRVEVIPPVGPRGQEFVFRAFGEDLDGDALEYGFDGGEYQRQDVFRKVHNGLGSQSLRVRVRDRDGGESPWAVAEFEVVNRPPTVSLSSSPQAAPLGQEVTFTASGYDPDGDPLEFSFENGGWGSSPYYRKRFRFGEPLRVSVLARDHFGGLSAPAFFSVGVVSEPFFLEWVSQPPKRVGVGEWVRFSVRGIGGAEPVRYSFDGGLYQASAEYEVRYQREGVYSLSVRGRDGSGRESQELVSELEVVPKHPKEISPPR